MGIYASWDPRASQCLTSIFPANAHACHRKYSTLNMPPGAGPNRGHVHILILLRVDIRQIEASVFSASEPKLWSEIGTRRRD